MEYLNYAEDVKIDPDALDVEWLGQPELMRKYAKHAADTKRVLDETKERLDVRKAQIEMDIRRNPDDYKLAKPTEAAIQSTILLQEDYQNLVKEYQEARYENEIAISAVRAIDQKKTALENLVRLLNASYFAGPQTPRDLQKESLEHKKRQTINAKVKISRKKRGKEE
jgi:hypothetical protein